MAMAGYDPRAALDLWELMACVEEDARKQGQSTSIENRFALLRTHPASEDRQEALKKDLDGAMRLWREHSPKIREKMLKEREREAAQRAERAKLQSDPESPETTGVEGAIA